MAKPPRIPPPTGEAAPVPSTPGDLAPAWTPEAEEAYAAAAKAEHAAAIAAQVPQWTGRVRCGLCGHERRIDATGPVAIDQAQRYPCFAGCRVVMHGAATARLSCVQVEG